MSSYSRFDRHEYMSSETLGDIMGIIREVRFEDNTFELTNMLYGLFDGYLYDNLIAEADEVTMSRDLYRKILKVFNTVCKYPKYSRYCEPADTTYVPEPVEYRDGMGVAEGKMYLASL
jgi:hypothetical protein